MRRISLIQTLFCAVAQIPTYLLIAAVRVYQFLISPVIGPSCRFRPTCSEYLVLAVRKYGLLRGVWKGVCRIGRCHPWHAGGHDPP